MSDMLPRSLALLPVLAGLAKEQPKKTSQLIQVQML